MTVDHGHYAVHHRAAPFRRPSLLHGDLRTQPDCLVVGQDTFRGPMPAAAEMLWDGTAVFRNDTVAAGMCMTPTESDRLNVIGDGGAETSLFRSASLRLV